MTIGMVVRYAVDEHPDLQGQVERGAWIAADGRLRPAPGRKDGASRLEMLKDAIPGDVGMAGLMVARGGDGLLGVAPKAKVLPIVIGTDAEPTYSRAVRWLVDRKVKVIYLPGANVWPTPGGLPSVEAIRYALSKDVVVVVGADSRLPYGGRDWPDDAVTERTPGVVVVSGVDRDGRFQRDSDSPALETRSPHLALTAPTSSKMVVAGFSERYDDSPSDYFSEHAPAAALVAGTAALVRAKHPKLNAASVINRLVATAKDAGRSGRDDEYGFGIVDPVAALTADVPTVTANPLGDPGPPQHPWTPEAMPREPTSGEAGFRWRAVLIGVGVLALPTVLAAGICVVVVRRRRIGQA